MVHKTTHRGVHSGHTLRAFNSRFSRRYHHQSCIVSRIQPELIRKLAGGAKEGEPYNNNVAVDVPLSLNKQSRWCLPSALIRQIESNDIADSALTVSVVERHKLKQHASCVSFHSNKGEMKRIKPRNGRYFGFRYPTLDGKSQRALRRERREELRAGKGRAGTGKTVEVFTQQGPGRRNLDLGDSEVRYEVYYPCPAWSSIAHNPKYIKQDVHTPPGERYAERVQSGKPRKQHQGKQRKRMSVKDLDPCDLPSFQHLSLKDHDPPATADLPSAAVHGRKEPGAMLELEDVREEQSTTQCLLTTLIEKAQQLQNLRGTAKARPRKRNEKNAGHHEDDKSHIVYVSDLDLPSSLAQSSDRSLPLVCPLPPSPQEATRVMLPKEDVSVISLKDCFGQNYFEAACKPRKFVLDITVNVQDVLKKLAIPATVAEKTSDAYLVCVHDGIYDDEYDVFKVLLNSRLHQGLLPVQINIGENQDLYRGTVMNLVSQTMDFVESLVTKLKEKDEFSASSPVIITRKPSERQLNSHLGSAEAYVPSVQRLFQEGSDVSDVTMPSLTDLLEEEPVFCEVCYEDISPMSMDGAAFTSLLKCDHQVCDACWWRHIHTRLGEGFVRLPCPGHDCQQQVKLGVLLSLVPLPTVEKLLQRQEEVRIGGSSTEKWCPNPSCGRVIRLHGDSPSAAGSPHQQDVVCGCGGHVCFLCLGSAHWPASCQQAQDYRSTLDSAVFPDRLAEVHEDSDAHLKAGQQALLQAENALLVEGKHCPNCNSFVFKVSGCPQMSCRCGQQFCWSCLRRGHGHPSRKGCVTETKEKELTTTLVVRHLEASPSAEATKKENRAPAASRRQRTSLLERAAEHRGHHVNKRPPPSVTTLAKKVASAAARDALLGQHVLKACGEVFPSSSSSAANAGGSAAAPGAQSQSASVLETVTAFLRKVARSKRELHQVVEYSLVLLKDLPDSLLWRRALRISEDLGAFCTFTQSVFEAWSCGGGGGGGRGSQSQSQSQSQMPVQEGVKAVLRLVEIQGWVHTALDAHVTTVRKLRSLHSPHLL